MVSSPVVHADETISTDLMESFAPALKIVLGTAPTQDDATVDGEGKGTER